VGRLRYFPRTCPSVGKMVERALEHLRQHVDPANANCKFRRALDEALVMSDLSGAQRAAVRLDIPLADWPEKDQIIGSLWDRYSSIIDIRVDGEPDDYILKGRSGGRVSDATIRSEMTTLRAIMNFAAHKKYIRDSQVFQSKLPSSKARREEFTPPEYRKLHSFARSWIKAARNDLGTWYRTMAYNFVLIMTNTGMRPSEARNLRWRDVASQTDKLGRQFVRLNVRGKGKHRTLVAASNVATYLDRIKQTSKHTELDDYVFVTDEGKMALRFTTPSSNGCLLNPGYKSVRRAAGAVPIASGIPTPRSGSRRASMCIFSLSRWGTSVKMIEDHYGHVTPVKNADRILQGLPGWEPIAVAPQETR
jgi:integrase